MWLVTTYVPVNGEGSWAAEILVAENHASKGVFTSRLLYIAYKPLFYCGHVYLLCTMHMYVGTALMTLGRPLQKLTAF